MIMTANHNKFIREFFVSGKVFLAYKHMSCNTIVQEDTSTWNGIIECYKHFSNLMFFW